MRVQYTGKHVPAENNNDTNLKADVVIDGEWLGQSAT